MPTTMTTGLFTFQRAEFNNQFRAHFGDNFQSWFFGLARMLHTSGDVQSIRLTQGDGKLDVAVLSEQLVYQCYGPSSHRPTAHAAKIEQDFWGAFGHLGGNLRKWIFVHNHPTGDVDKDSYKALNDIVAECARREIEVKVLSWGIEELWSALQDGLSYNALRELFGSPDPVVVSYTCLEELLLKLERTPYPVDAVAVSKPALQKLEFNDLGAAYRREIREGRNAMRVVEDYLASRAASDAEFGEKLAQRFRDRYDFWKMRETLTPSEIYEKLRLDAGWQASPDVSREFATRSILAYFFDSCDIFENPPTEP